MNWEPAAEAAIKKVPFFVRKRVRAKVEKEAQKKDLPVVTLDHVKAVKAGYLTNMESEVKGYQLDACFGESGCPNRVIDAGSLMKRIEKTLQKTDLRGFLKSRVSGKLRFHHEFRVTLADCPNACSQPQIKDVGIIGACLPEMTDEACSMCEACVEVCREDAIELDTADSSPLIDTEQCLYCGKCFKVCPTGTLVKGDCGFRVQLGGKLGRHPQLARELPGIFSEDEVLEILEACLVFYKKRTKTGERFGELLTGADFEDFVTRFSKKDAV
jgi:anaerobic sulfite reductase subunit C